MISIKLDYVGKLVETETNKMQLRFDCACSRYREIPYLEDHENRRPRILIIDLSASRFRGIFVQLQQLPLEETAGLRGGQCDARTRRELYLSVNDMGKVLQWQDINRLFFYFFTFNKAKYVSEVRFTPPLSFWLKGR